MVDGPYTSKRTHPRAVSSVVLVVLRVAIAAILVSIAFAKLTSSPVAVAVFAEIGIGQWLRYAIGGLELALAIGVLIPRSAGIAALSIVFLMVGATLTELQSGTEEWPVRLAVAVLAMIVVWGRRSAIMGVLRQLD